MRTAYVNGRYVPHHLAQVAMEDRGYQFADGIYEVIVFRGKKLLDEPLHLARLKRSLNEMRIALPMPEAALKLVMRQLIARNPYGEGTIYLQITRGVAPRNHLFSDTLRPVLTMAVMPLKVSSAAALEQGVAVISRPDLRWGRCDIKAIGLAANSMAKNEAHQAGAWEALLIDAAGIVTEGAATNAFMVKNGRIVTHPANREILPGVRRTVLERLAAESQIGFDERAFTLEEARAADEFFLTGATTSVLPVTVIDGAPVGSGRPGPVTKRLIELYREHFDEQLGLG